MAMTRVWMAVRKCRHLAVQGSETGGRYGPDNHGGGGAGVAVAVRLARGVRDAVARVQSEMTLSHPEIHLTFEDKPDLFAFVRVAFGAFGTGRQERVDHLDLRAHLRGQEFVDDALVIAEPHAVGAADDIAFFLGWFGCAAGEEPLHVHAKAFGDADKRGDRREGEVALYLADFAL